MMRPLHSVFILYLTLVQSLLAEERPCVGALLALSGKFSEVGNDCRQAIEAVRGSGEKFPFEIIFEDTRAEPKLAINAFRKVVNQDKCLAVITQRSPVGLALNPLSKSMQVPLLGAVAVTRFVEENPFAYRMWAGTREEAEELVRDMLEQHVSRLAIISAEDEWNIALERDLASVLEGTKLRVVSQESISADSPDLHALILRVRQSNADAVFINAGIAQSGLVARRLYEAGWGGRKYATFWFAKAESLEVAGLEASHGVHFVETSGDLPKLTTLLKHSRGVERVSAMHLSCFASMTLLKNAFSEAKGNISQERIQAMLKNEISLPLPDGDVVLNDRKALFPLRVKEIQDGKVVDVSRQQ